MLVAVGPGRKVFVPEKSVGICLKFDPALLFINKMALSNTTRISIETCEDPLEILIFEDELEQEVVDSDTIKRDLVIEQHLTWLDSAKPKAITVAFEPALTGDVISVDRERKHVRHETELCYR